MKMTIKRCKLTRKQQEKLIEFFVAQTTARMAADLMVINRQTAILFYYKIRGIIFQRLACETGIFAGEIEVDESYFGGIRKGKRGRGAAGKAIVFGLLKRGDKVYVQVVDDTKRNTLMPIIRDKVQADSVVYTDCYSAYNSLDVSGFKHQRINHQTHFAEQNSNHINGIENFWNQAKRVLRKYNGIPKNNFHLFIKECEFRFNYGTPNQQLKTLIKTLKKWCLK
jgi:transposase